MTEEDLNMRGSAPVKEHQHKAGWLDMAMSAEQLHKQTRVEFQPAFNAWALVVNVEGPIAGETLARLPARQARQLTDDAIKGMLVGCVVKSAESVKTV